MNRFDKIGLALLLCFSTVGFLELKGSKKRLQSTKFREESIESRAKSIIDSLDRLRILKNDNDALYMFDFNNTLYIQNGPKKLGSVIATDVVMKSLLDRASEMRDDHAQNIEDFLVARAVELGSHRITSFAIVRKLYENDENFRTNLAELVYKHFRKKVALNHRISYLLNFGCSREQIEANYNRMTKDYLRYYRTIEQNPIIVEIISQLLVANKKVIIFTDGAEADVLAGSHHMGLEETIVKRLAEFGVKLDSRTLIIAGESRMKEAQRLEPGVGVLVPLVSLFKRRAKISEYFFDITAKDCPNSRRLLEMELKEVYGLDTKNTMLVMFDDSPSILKSLENQGVVPVRVDGTRVILPRIGNGNTLEQNK
ncbi:MAG: hypothetical protein LBI29_00610 [Rickettsiales bacterium]|nr:hypothetical protein [Rickettsiales bacterium]